MAEIAGVCDKRFGAVRKALAECLDAIVFDVRFSPFSRNPEWSGKRLSALLGRRYRHVKALGNANYKNGGDIELVDFAGGLAMIDASPKPVMLMCVCSKWHSCHRTVIAEKLRALGFNIAIYPSAGMSVVCAALEASYGHLRSHGSTDGSPVPAYTMAQLHELTGFPEVWEFEQRYAEV